MGNTNYAGKSKNEMIAKFERAKDIGVEAIARNEMLREELARQRTLAGVWRLTALASSAVAVIVSLGWWLT